MSQLREPNAEIESLLAAAVDGRLAESDCAPARAVVAAERRRAGVLRGARHFGGDAALGACTAAGG